MSHRNETSNCIGNCFRLKISWRVISWDRYEMMMIIDHPIDYLWHFEVHWQALRNNHDWSSLVSIPPPQPVGDRPGHGGLPFSPHYFASGHRTHPTIFYFTWIVFMISYMWNIIWYRIEHFKYEIICIWNHIWFLIHMKQNMQSYMKSKVTKVPDVPCSPHQSLGRNGGTLGRCYVTPLGC